MQPTLPPFGLAEGVARFIGALAVLIALYHRDARDGSGLTGLPLVDPQLSVPGPGPGAYHQLGVIARRHGNRSPNSLVPDSPSPLHRRLVAESQPCVNLSQAGYPRERSDPSLRPVSVAGYPASTSAPPGPCPHAGVSTRHSVARAWSTTPPTG
jgi:hypothetical protein